jgi:hypothetical protein
MKKKLELKTNEGSITFTIEDTVEGEKKLKEYIQAHIVYDLLFLSKKYKNKDDVFDFADFTSLEQYGMTSLYSHQVFDFIKDITFFSEDNIEELILLHQEHKNLMIPMWYNHLLSQNPKWIDLQEKSRKLLASWEKDYERIDLDDFIEEYDI